MAQSSIGKPKLNFIIFFLIILFFKICSYCSKTCHKTKVKLMGLELTELFFSPFFNRGTMFAIFQWEEDKLLFPSLEC